MFAMNMLVTVSFVASAAPPKTSKKHCHSYSMDGDKNEGSLGRVIYNNKLEEYKKMGYEDGVNDVTMSVEIPRGYFKAYEDEYKKGQLIYNRDIRKITKSNIENNVSFCDNSSYINETENEGVPINLKRNIVGNKIYDNKNNNVQEKYDNKLEEYKKKGYEDGLNNISIKPFVPRKYRQDYNTEYERGQEEYRNRAIGKFGYEDGIKNRVMMDNVPAAYQPVYEREYRKGLVTYLKDNLKNKTVEFGKLVPTTPQQAQKLGESHGLNNITYRVGAPEDIQEEYSKAYFSAKRNKLFEQGYNAAIKSKNKKTLKKTYIVRLYGQWYNAGFKYGREEYVKQLEKIKKQGYADGLKKHIRKTNIRKEYEQIYRKEYDKGREKYIENMMEKIRKHRMKMKMKHVKQG